MATIRERRQMEPRDIQKLMDGRHWSRTQLAAAIDVTEATVHAWMSGRRFPGGPAVILMRLWLSELGGSNGRRKLAATAK